jgi:hypothetical protein
MANSSFLAEAPGGMVVISILDNQDGAAALRLAETNLHMRRHGIPTSEVILRADGQPISTLRGKPVLLRWWLAGRTYDVVPDELVPAAARLLGRIHGVDPTGLDIPVGTRRLGPAHRVMLDEFPDQDHAGWIRRRLRRLDGFFPPVDDARRGAWTTLHGDFNGPNIVVGPSGDLWVIDWETTTIDDPALDCGMSMISICRDGNRLSGRRVQNCAASTSGGSIQKSTISTSQRKSPCATHPARSVRAARSRPPSPDRAAFRHAPNRAYAWIDVSPAASPCPSSAVSSRPVVAPPSAVRNTAPSWDISRAQVLRDRRRAVRPADTCSRSRSSAPRSPATYARQPSTSAA